MTFEKGKSYKTVGGWEAICGGLDDEDDVIFCHKGSPEGLIALVHYKNGTIYGTAKGNDWKVTHAEYTEPRKGEVWVNVYENRFAPFFNKEDAVRAEFEPPISRIRCEWQEGVFDE